MSNRAAGGPDDPRFQSIDEVAERLAGVDYLADRPIATIVYLADRLAKPLLVEGPAGVGKTQLAKAVAECLGIPLLRLQCYEGVDESKALYEWNYKKQLLRIQASGDAGWDELSQDIFSEPFLLDRPVLQAIRSSEPVALLIDEIDKLDFEAEALLLEVLSDWQITIPEMGTIRAQQIPFVFLTSNNERELTEALKRRCLYLHIDLPDVEREKAIVLQQVPGITEALAEQAARVVHSIRSLDLKKAPSIAETLDWCRTLLHLNIAHLDEDSVGATLPILLKFESDIAKATDHLKTRAKPGA
ncbi:MAG: MoxR family ATPase [Actinomycetota bacterium]|nr:MoxR family ATPase [Actinomycetota bacterium]